MKTSNNLSELLTLCDEVIAKVKTVRRELALQMATVRELLCGEWARPDRHVSYRVYKSDGRYMIDERFANEVNSRMTVYSQELLEDEQGNLYIVGLNRAIGYDREHDMLLSDMFGEFERIKKNEDEE